jgi:hypothetical protein
LTQAICDCDDDLHKISVKLELQWINGCKGISMQYKDIASCTLIRSLGIYLRVKKWNTDFSVSNEWHLRLMMWTFIHYHFHSLIISQETNSKIGVFKPVWCPKLAGGHSNHEHAQLASNLIMRKYKVYKSIYAQTQSCVLDLIWVAQKWEVGTPPYLLSLLIWLTNYLLSLLSSNLTKSNWA